MSELDPTRSFTDELCLECGYRRQGLASETACPECGGIPDAAAVCLRGASDSAPPWVAILVGGVSLLLLCAFLAMFVRRLAVGGGPNVNFAATWGIVMGLAFGLRGLRRWRMRERGGDIVWVLDEDGLAVRVGRSIAHVDARDLPRFKVERKLAAKRTGVVLRPKGLWNSLTTHRLWAVRGDPAVERMLHALTRRGASIARMAARRSGQGVARPSRRTRKGACSASTTVPRVMPRSPDGPSSPRSGPGHAAEREARR